MTPTVDPLEIIKTGFGEVYAGVYPNPVDGGRFPVREVLVRKCDFEMRENSVRVELDRIDWQLVLIYSIDKNRFENCNDGHIRKFPRHCNIYGISPIVMVDPRPAIVFHATKSDIAKACRKEGIRQSDGKNRYPDTKGKIHVCESLLGDFEGADCWAKLLSEKQVLSTSDFSILQISLDLIPSARAHKDFHSSSGIVLDRIDVIPPASITDEFRLVDGAWKSVGFPE